MTRINLLPWREKKREQEKKLFTTMLCASIASAVFVVFLINYYASNLVSNQMARNQKLQQEIAALDRQIAEIKGLEKVRGMLLSRMAVVRNLQSTRTLMVHLFDELIKIMPSGIVLAKIEGKNTVISLSGYSESNTYVSQVMKNIENNEWIHNPVLNEIKKTEDKKQPADNQFKLTFMLGPVYQVKGTQ